MSDAILKQLVEMSNYLGDPQKTYAILGEGNTSARLSDDTFAVKASGTTLSTIDASGFVEVSISRVLTILDDPHAGDAEVSRVLKDALVQPGETRRPSVETMLHAILLSYPEYHYIGHSHPVFTNMWLCSVNAEAIAARRIYPDHIVCMGHKSVFVPYVDPGLTLARETKTRLEAFIREEGVLPKAIVMQNHGLITMGDSPKAVLSAHDMCEKVSRVIVGSYTCGGPQWMSQHDIDRIYTRPDEHYRIANISGKA
jgi:rhamnose utilization protein RhaD (predicted bifunctional aldolase and dehydrogenase)